MITFASRKDVPELKRIWKLVFEDEEEYLEEFFHTQFDPENTLVYWKDKTIASMLYLIPYKTMQNKVEVQAYYLFALATLPEFRGQGIMKELIAKAEVIAKKKAGKFLFLVPAEDDLISYYAGMGFKKIYYKTEFEWNLQQINKLGRKASDKESKIELLEIDTTEEGELWGQYLSGVLTNENSEFLVMTKEQFLFSLHTLLEDGAEAYFLCVNEEIIGYVIWMMEGEDIRILQGDIPEEYWERVCQILSKNFNFQKIVMEQVPAWMQGENRKMIPYAMRKSLTGEDGEKTPFIGLVLE